MAERLGPFSVPPQPAVGHLCECRGGLRPEPAVGVSLRVPRRSAAGASVKRPLLRSGGFPTQLFLRSGGFPARLFSAVRRLSRAALFAVRRLSRAALFCGPEAFPRSPFCGPEAFPRSPFCGPEAFPHGLFLQSGRPVTSAPASRPRRGRRLPSAAPAFRPAYCSRFSRKMFRWASSGLRRSSSTNSTSSSTSATASR